MILRFFFDYMRSRFQESISYELVAKDRLAIGDALKRVSLGYFQKNSTGTILNSITTGLNLLENMGIRMIDNFRRIPELPGGLSWMRQPPVLTRKKAGYLRFSGADV